MNLINMQKWSASRPLPLIFIAIVLVGLLLGRLIPSLSDNIRSTGFVRYHVQDGSWPYAELADRAPSPGQKYIVGALLVDRKEITQSITLLTDYAQVMRDPRQTTWYLIGKAHEMEDDLLRAGVAYEHAGLFDLLDYYVEQGQLHTYASRAQVETLSRISMELARQAEQNGDYQVALTHAARARGMSGDIPTIAEAYRLEALAAFGTGDFTYALSAIRQSIDVLRPQSLSDERYRFLFEAAFQIVQRDRCQPIATNPTIALLVVYLAHEVGADTDCVSRLAEALSNSGPAEMRAYVLLRQAFAAWKRHEPEQVSRYLDAAEQLGLPPAWRSILSASPDEVTDRDLALAPTYTVADTSISGYEVDPLQVELGLPLDIILFRKHASSDVYRLHLMQAFNLAPNPGFEYGPSEDCRFNNCFPLGFESDIYNGLQAPRSHQLKLESRPLTPKSVDASFASTALMLSNGAVPDQPQRPPSSSVTSFGRPVRAGGRYLMAGWIKARGGNGYIGFCWRCEDSNPPYDYVTSQYTSPDWSYGSRIFSIAEDPEVFRLWLLNFDTRGDALYDGVIFVELPVDMEDGLEQVDG